METLQEQPESVRTGSFPCSRPSAFQAESRPARTNLLAPPRRFDPDQPELIDRPDTSRASLLEELQLLETISRRLGGHRLILEYLEQLVQPARAGLQSSPLTILDLGTGIADVPRAIVRWAAKRRIPVRILGVDRNPAVLEFAREACHGWPEIDLEQHDLLALPYPAGSFDLVLCSLTLHHFCESQAIEILRRIHDLARRGFIINDLRRNWPAILTMELLARTVIRSAIFRHDAPQSCRAAFTVRELRAMAMAAGISGFQIKRHHAFFRMVLLGRK